LVNILEDKKATLNFNERVINVAFQYSYVVATTLTKCRIYNIEVWTLVLQETRQFCHS
jgi:hypothetical protein